MKRKLSSKEYTVIFVVLVLLGVMSLMVFARRPQPKAAEPKPVVKEQESNVLVYANADSPGERINKSDFTGDEKRTIFYIHSSHCQYCVQMKPLVEKLAQVDPTSRVVEVELDRKGYDGIDYHSPIGKQFAIEAVPAFVVFNKTGRLQAKHTEAKTFVRQLMIEKGIAY